MIARIQPGSLHGTVRAIPSKSEAHRALICAALSDAPCTLRMQGTSEDIDATVRCLTAFGTRIERVPEGLCVYPAAQWKADCEADCGESGSTLRFLLPVAAALGIRARFHMHGRLPQRPLFPLDRELTRGGCAISRPEADILEIGGRLRPGRYVLPGDVSSQYITGMLLALSLSDGESGLEITGKSESVEYVRMTLSMMARFGVFPEKTAAGFRIVGGRLTSPDTLDIGGDWSNAAFWLCADALPGCKVEVTGLDPDSAQGDKRIVDELKALCAAEAEHTIDAADIPDLIPALAVCACASGKTVRVAHAERLRIKESDRLSAICGALTALGGCVMETEDGLLIRGGGLRGGETDSAGDHRIAMMAAVASALCREPVVIRGAKAVGKSYPAFWDDFARLGGRVELMNGGGA